MDEAGKENSPQKTEITKKSDIQGIIPRLERLSEIVEEDDSFRAKYVIFPKSDNDFESWYALHAEINLISDDWAREPQEPKITIQQYLTEVTTKNNSERNERDVPLLLAIIPDKFQEIFNLTAKGAFDKMLELVEKGDPQHFRHPDIAPFATNDTYSSPYYPENYIHFEPGRRFIMRLKTNLPNVTYNLILNNEGNYWSVERGIGPEEFLEVKKMNHQNSKQVLTSSTTRSTNNISE